MTGAIFVGMLACSGTPSPTLDTLPAGSARDMLATCAREPFPELSWGCRVEAAAAAGREGDGTLADEACSPITAEVWRDECHFRAGEELGKHGHTYESLEQCGQSARYGRFCLTHAAWGMPPDTARSAEEWADAATTLLPEALAAAGADVLRSRWWFNHYVGTGMADPLEAQKASPADGPYARGAWAIEILRITGGRVGLARLVWAGDLGAPPGTPLPREARVGRYDVALAIPEEQKIRWIRTFGDARRLVGRTIEEDLEIAYIEAMYFNGPSDGAPFAAWLDDPRPYVRYAALHKYRILPSADVEPTLARLAQDPDPIVRAHAQDGLKYRTWLGKPNATGPRSPERTP